MNKKFGLIYKLVFELIFIVLLFYTFVTNNNFINLIFLPFIICFAGDVVKTIFLLKGDNINNSFFEKVSVIGFFSFVFLFLIIWTGLSILSKDYSLIIVSIPFWLISIFLVRKKLFGKETKLFKKFNFKQIFPYLFLSLFILIGIVMLYFGISNSLKNLSKTSNYVETIGYFVDYEIYNSDEDGTTYKLIYSYNVNNKEYTVSTDYGTNMIPKEGSSRTIKYNPSNPSEAIISGGSSEIVLLLIGIMFTMIPFVILINMSPKIKEKLDNLNFNVTTLLIGIVFLIIGFMALYMMTGTFSIIEIYKSFSLNYLIPYLILLMFIIVGILLIIGSFKRNSE